MPAATENIATTGLTTPENRLRQSKADAARRALAAETCGKSFHTMRLCNARERQPLLQSPTAAWLDMPMLGHENRAMLDRMCAVEYLFYGGGLTWDFASN